MFSFVKKVVTSIIPWGSESSEQYLQTEQNIINSIQSLTLNADNLSQNEIDEPKELLGESDPVKFKVNKFKCVYKTGKITYYDKEYGLIDNLIYFEPSQVSPNLFLKVNDEVQYLSYKLKENETERVYKINGLINDSWNTAEGLECPNESEKTEQEEKEIFAFSRIITGRVIKRRKREIYIESADIWCNLDKIRTSFIPVEGDWVELQADVSVSENSANLSGVILGVNSIKPLLTKSGFGRISLWSDTTKEGAIENLIYFTIISCRDGYVPSLGDEVLYNAVESDQDKFKWRAVKVSVNLKKFHSTKLKDSNENGLSDKNDPFGDKNGISVLPSVCVVDTVLNKTQTVVLEVINNGTDPQTLKSTKFHRKSGCQLKLLSPKMTSSVCIFPKETMKFSFLCKAKTLGLTGEIFYFYFQDFTIAKRFEINVVGSEEMNKLLECKFDTVFKVFQNKKNFNNNFKADLVMYGPKPWKPPKFVSKERQCIFKVPKVLWDLIFEASNEFKVIKSLTDYAPYLMEDLNFEHYEDRYA